VATKALVFTLERCLVLDDIDGVILSFMYEPGMVKMFGRGIGSPEQMLNSIKSHFLFIIPFYLSFFPYTVRLQSIMFTLNKILHFDNETENR